MVLITNETLHFVTLLNRYWGHVNTIGPRSCYDEGKRVAESLMVAYAKQVVHMSSFLRAGADFCSKLCEDFFV